MESGVCDAVVFTLVGSIGFMVPGRPTTVIAAWLALGTAPDRVA